MKKIHILSLFTSIVLALFVVLQASCQNTGKFVFEGQIKGLKEGKIILNQVQGHKEFKINETLSRSDGSFSIRLDEMPRTGQFRLRIDPGGRNGILDFLFTGESHIRFVTHNDYLTDSIRFEKSEINKVWYGYFEIKEAYEARLSILEHLLNIYPADERFYPEVIKEFNILQDELEEKVQKTISNYEGSLLARYIRSDQPPRINPHISTEERQEFIRYNYLNNVDFTDTLLLYTDIFPGKALSYIMLFRGQRLDRDQQAMEFIKATDNLLPLAMIQPTVYNYLLGYTISGFEQIGLEEVLMHIADNYPVDESCISDHDSGELQRRMDGYRLLAPGKPAPPINTTDIIGEPFKLSDVGSDNVLIVFWASWCPHCTVILPEIRSLAVHKNTGSVSGQSPKLKVVSVSIDHSESDFEDYMRKNDLNDPSIRDFWVNLCDFEAWDGKVPDDYYLYATPTMILLDKDHKIVGKPSTVQDLIKQLGN
jgi:thiol-disulfide isomerase/thioredoxin